MEILVFVEILGMGCRTKAAVPLARHSKVPMFSFISHCQKIFAYNVFYALLTISSLLGWLQWSLTPTLRGIHSEMTYVHDLSEILLSGKRRLYSGISYPSSRSTYSREVD